MDSIARATILIASPRARVWSQLLAPETITQIMPVTEVVTPWRLGEPFLWKIDLQGLSSEVRGTVLRLEPEALIEYDYVDPHSERVYRVENRHRVTIALSDEAEGTRVSVSQDNHLGSAAHKHAEGGWRMALNHLRGLVEGKPPVWRAER